MRVVVQLVDRNSDDVVQRLDLFEGDGACVGFHGWIEGDFGDTPIVTST